MSEGKIDITQLAESLKGGVAKKSTVSGKKSKTDLENKTEKLVETAEEEKEEATEQVAEQTVKKSKVPRKGRGKERREKVASLEVFQGMIEEINALEGYDHEGMVYVDSEIHEVLKRLKSSSKLKIYHLANHLFSEWIKKNQEAINEIINQPKKNRFIT